MMMMIRFLCQGDIPREYIEGLEMPLSYLTHTMATLISQGTEIKLETGPMVQLQYKRDQE